MTDTDVHSHPAIRSLPPIMWGALVGITQAASPLAVRWLEPATVHALYLAFIAAVYIGFAVADGRAKVIAGESAIAAGFVLLASAGVNGTAWMIVAAYAAHGLKDFWQQRIHYVAHTRWWPPFCATVDLLVAVILSASAGRPRAPVCMLRSEG